MTTQTEALKLALECAERCENIDGMYSWSDTITAIKEALAKPEQEPVYVQLRHKTEYGMSEWGSPIDPKERHSKWADSVEMRLLYTDPPPPPPQQQQSMARPRFNCWSTNDGDSWVDDPADADVLYATLGDEPQVGDEFEIIAGWRSVKAKYRVTKAGVDGDCAVECISHPQENAHDTKEQP